MIELKRMEGEPDRKTYIGGSDVAAIMGLDPYGKTPYTTWLRKTGQADGEMDAEKKLFLNRRKRWEGPIIEMLREECEAKVVSINNRYIDREIPFFAAEIDFEWEDRETGLIENGEIKTVSPFNFGEGKGWGESGTGDIPIHYEAQVQWGMGITGARRAILTAMVGLDNMIFYPIVRDDKIIAQLRERCARFWTDHVLTGIPPEPLIVEDLTMMMLKRKGRPVVLDAETLKALNDIKEIRARQKLFEADEKECQFKLFDFIRKQWDKAEALTPEELPIDNASLLMVNDDGGQVEIARWNRQRGTSFDQKRLKIDNPDLVQQYTREYWYRNMRFIKPKA